MPPKSKNEPEPAGVVDETGTEPEYATADEMATVLDELASLSERVERMERESRSAASEPERFRDARQAAAARTDPTLRASVGHGARRRQSEGDRQDQIQRENAERHLHEPAGDGVVPIPAPGDDIDQGGRGFEDPASPHFEDEGGMAQIDEPTPDSDREPAPDVNTGDVTALNPTR